MKRANIRLNCKMQIRSSETLTGQTIRIFFYAIYVYDLKEC